MKPRVLMVMTSAHGEEAKQMQKALRRARSQVKEYTVYAEFFDPESESPRRYDHFPERLEKIRRGHFEAFLILGSLVTGHVVDLLQAIPEGTEIGNFATPGKDLDIAARRILGVKNGTDGVGAQDSS